MSAIERAQALGREHGARDAEAWLSHQEDGWGLTDEDSPLPEPNLDGAFYYVDGSAHWHQWELVDAGDAYCAAYRAARDETIRARCAEVAS